MDRWTEKILRFIPLWMTPKRKRRVDEVFDVLRRLKEEGKLEIYKVYENGKWEDVIRVKKAN